jgi:hypothetical protein
MKSRAVHIARSSVARNSAMRATCSGSSGRLMHWPRALSMNGCDRNFQRSNIGEAGGDEQRCIA